MSDLIIKKNGTDYKLPMLAEHYPADRVYLHGDITDDVESAIDELDTAVDTINAALLKAEIKTVTFTNVGYNSYSNNSGGVFICSADSTHLIASGNAAGYTRLFNVNNQNPSIISDPTVTMDCLVFSHV